MKHDIAIVQDSLTSRGGGELFSYILAKHYKAPVYTSRFTPGNTFEELSGVEVIEINPSKTPKGVSGKALSRLSDAKKFEALDLNGFESVVLSGTEAQFAATKNPRNVLYCHTPARALYDLYHPLQRRHSSLAGRLSHKLWSSVMIPWDQKIVREKVNKIVANSKNTYLRILRYYGRDDALVINPPIMTKIFKPGKPKGYFLSVQRVMPFKRVELQLDVFSQLPKERLVMVGEWEGGEFQEKIKKRISSMENVEWRTGVSDNELAGLYSHSKAVIQTAMFEDFGRVPVEANASGKACLAVGEEGFTESIAHGKTGLLIEPPYRENFVKALKEFDAGDFKLKDLLGNAKRFSEEAFFKKFDPVVEQAANSAAKR